MGLVRIFLWTLQVFSLYIAVEALEFVEYPTSGVRTGQKYVIRYNSNDSAPVSINLMRKIQHIHVVVSELGTAESSYFEWNAPRALAEGDNYALSLNQSDTWAYSGFFNVTTGVLDISSSITSVPSTPSSSQVPPSSPITSGERSNQLQPSIVSAGMKVAIGVGSTFAGLVVLPLAYFLGRTHKKTTQLVDTETGRSWVKPELEGKAAYRHEYTAELEGSTAVQEMRADADAKELVGPLTHNRAELNAESKILEVDTSSIQRSSDESQLHSEGDGNESRNAEDARNGTKEGARIARNNDSQSQPS